jgi:hypothetical protein
MKRISLMPVRKLKKSYQNVTGFFHSNLLRRLVQFDSILERDFILLLDVHPAVRWFSEQPMKIRFIDATGVDQVYVPDFHIEFTGDRFLGRDVTRPWIVETKYRSDLAENWPRVRPKIRAGFHEAHKRHSSFHIVTESRMATAELSNARFLKRFANAELPAGVLEELLNKLRSTGRTSVGSLLSVGLSFPSRVGEQAIWTAIARRLILADFERPLGPETLVWIG